MITKMKNSSGIKSSAREKYKKKEIDAFVCQLFQFASIEYRVIKKRTHFGIATVQTVKNIFISRLIFLK